MRKNIAIWFNGNNWEQQAFMELEDATLFIEVLLEKTPVTWFVTDTIGRDMLLDRNVIW